jgi:hypothetical protein
VAVLAAAVLASALPLARAQGESETLSVAKELALKYVAQAQELATTYGAQAQELAKVRARAPRGLRLEGGGVDGAGCAARSQQRRHAPRRPPHQHAPPPRPPPPPPQEYYAKGSAFVQELVEKINKKDEL